MKVKKRDNELMDFEDVSIMPEAVIFRFFGKIRREEHWHLNIVQHFHFTVSDSQMKSIYDYFKNYGTHFFVDSKKVGEYIEVQLELFRRYYSQIKQEPVVIRIQQDSEGTFSIRSVQVMNRKKWTVRRTIFTSSKAHRNEVITATGSV